jgi:hypothetical protein
MERGSRTQVELQLRQVRWHLNLLALQKWGSIAVSSSVLTVAVIVVSALRAPEVFPWVAAAATLTALGAVGLCLSRLRSGWIRSSGVARLVDRTIGLDDRLATLLMPDAIRSPMYQTLLDQVLETRPRWTPSALDSRRLSLLLVLVPLAFGVLSVTAFYGRPAGRAGRTHEWAKTTPAAREPELSPQLSGAGYLTRHRADLDPEDISPLSAAERRALGKGSGAGPRDGSASTATTVGRGTLTHEEALSEATDRRASIRPALPGGVRPANANTHTDNVHAEPAERRPRHRSAIAPASTESPAERTVTRTDGARVAAHSGSGAGSKGGPEPNPPLGSRDSPTTHGGVSSSVAVRLGAFALAPRHDAEPQTRPPRAGSITGGTDSASPPPSPNEPQTDDAFLRRTHVPPDHERVIRTLFTRQ